MFLPPFPFVDFELFDAFDSVLWYWLEQRRPIPFGCIPNSKGVFRDILDSKATWKATAEDGHPFDELHIPVWAKPALDDTSSQSPPMDRPRPMDCLTGYVRIDESVLL